MNGARPAATRPRLLIISTLSIIGLLYAMLLMGDWAFVHEKFAPARLTDTIEHQDFGRFWYVGQRLLQPLTPLAEPPAALSAQYPVDILKGHPRPRDVWIYPPTADLTAMLFALLPMNVSFWCWSALTVAVGALLLRGAGLAWPPILLGLACPAGLINFTAGQNGALLGSLLVACLLMMDTRPRLAGLLAGCLSLKPQFGLCLITILPQRWRDVLPWTMLSLIGLIGLSILLEGPAMWVWFFTVARPAAMQIITGPFVDAVPTASISVFIMARSFGAGLVLSGVLQALAAITALILIGAAWSRPLPALPRAAFTVCLSVLITPYGFLYDLIGFGIVMAAMFCVAADRLKPVFAALWLISGYTVMTLHYTGLVLFPVFACAGALFCRPDMSRQPAGHGPAVMAP